MEVPCYHFHLPVRVTFSVLCALLASLCFSAFCSLLIFLFSASGWSWIWAHRFQLPGYYRSCVTRTCRSGSKRALAVRIVEEVLWLARPLPLCWLPGGDFTGPYSSLEVPFPGHCGFFDAQDIVCAAHLRHVGGDTLRNLFLVLTVI